MKYLNFKTYKIIIVLILILIPTIIFRNNIILFFAELVGQENRVLNIIKKNKEDLPNKENAPIKISPETPGGLKLIDRLLNNKEVTLSREKIIFETNVVRAKSVLPGLKENPLLNITAEKKLNDIFSQQYFEHISPGGVGIENLVNEAGYEYILIGENLAMGNFKSEKALVDAWMGSFGHRKNILRDDYMEIGVAVGKGNLNGENVWVAIQHFGTPKNVCPKIDSKLHDLIIFNQNQIDSLDKDLNSRLLKIKTSRGFYASRNVDQERKVVDEYNRLATYYNKLVEQVEKDAITYNSQIKSFNDCVQKYQE